MTDRTVRVNLIAQVNGYLTGMAKAAAATKATGTEAEKLAQKKQGLQTLGTSLLAVGTLAAVGVGLAIKSFADFDAKMSQVQTLSHATGAEMDSLTQSALHLGQAIGFTAEQTADAEIELVKAGVSVKDIIGGALPGALELAAAGQIDVADATEIATIALTQFKLAGKDVPHVADLLAAGADKALGSVGDLGEALKSGGLVAAQFGVSLDETVGTLSAFANAGLIGETAGTDLRQLLLKLANPSKEAADEIKNLGLQIYGANNQFVGINSLSVQLHDKLSKLTPEARNSAEAIIFGSRAIAGANVLYEEGGKSGGGIQKWTNSVNDSGFAAQQAAGKMNNLNGDAKKLAAAFQTDLIKSGSSVNDLLRGIVQNITFLVSAIGDVPQPVLAVGLVLTGLVAAVGLVGGTALLAVPKIAAFKNALLYLEISGKSAATGIGLAGGAIALATLVIGAFIDQQAQSKQATEAFTASLDKSTGALTKYSKTLEVKRLQDLGAFDAAKKMGISQNELADAVLHGGKALDLVNDKIDKYRKTDAGFRDSISLTGGTTKSLSDALGQVRGEVISGTDAFKNQKAALGENANSTNAAADAYQSAADQAKALNDQISQLTDQVNAANKVGQDAVSANASYQQALADTAEAAKTAKGGVEQSTAAGSANAAMLADLAQKGQDAANAQLALDGNSQAYQEHLKATHDAVYQRALDFHATATEAQAIADSVAAIPTSAEVKILVDTAKATSDLNAFNALLTSVGSRVANILVRTQLPDINGGRPGAANGKIYSYANGGKGEGIYSGGAAIYKFAEPETGWEAFISGRPSARQRNIGLWQDAGRMLGVSGSGGDRNISVTLATTTADPAAASELMMQQLRARLVNLK